MLLNGLRKIAGNGPKVFRDASLAGMRAKESKGAKSDIPSAMKEVVAGRGMELKRNDKEDYKKVFGS